MIITISDDDRNLLAEFTYEDDCCDCDCDCEPDCCTTAAEASCCEVPEGRAPNPAAVQYGARMRASVLRTALRLKRQGVLVRGMSREEVKALIVEGLLGDDPDRFGQPGWDWEQFLKWLEMILPIVLLVIGLL